MAEFIGLLKLLRDWITSPKTMWIFLLAISALLTLIWSIGQKSVASLLSDYTFLCLTLLVCAAGLLVHYIYQIGVALKHWHRLRHLAEDEKKILAKFVAEKSNTIAVFYNEQGAQSLLDDGILQVASETGRVHQSVGCTYYTLKPPILRYFVKHPSHVGL